jgi:hypothetical protein
MTKILNVNIGLEQINYLQNIYTYIYIISIIYEVLPSSTLLNKLPIDVDKGCIFACQMSNHFLLIGTIISYQIISFCNLISTKYLIK